MSLRKQATSGLVWTFAQQFGNQAIGFVVSLILARLLLPEEFGLIGMISVVIAIGGSLLNAGLTQSLIRGKNLDQEDYSTVFYFNLIASILIYILAYLLAPFISDFYDQPVLTNIVRLYCLTFITSAFSAVQMARLTKRMEFKTLAFIGIPSNLLGGVVGVSMAYLGYGVWSLVWSYICTTLGRTIQLWIYSKWSPSLVFSRKKFKEHFSFGYKLTLSGLLNTFYNNIYLIVIGRFFSANQVGLYTRAETMKQLPVTNLSNALNKVTYPLFSTIQDDDVRLKKVYKQLMQMVVYIITPILVFMAVLAEPLFRFLFTEKWVPAVPYFQILCANGILYPIHAYNLNVLKVKGRSDLFLKLEVVKKIIITIAIVIALQFGIFALLYGQVATSILGFFINTYYTGRFIDYPGWEQAKDIAPIIGLTLLCGAAIVGLDYYLDLYDSLDITRIVSGGTLGAAFYIGSSYLLKFDSFKDAQKIVFKR
jgi:teichuronic acid exporter